MKCRQFVYFISNFKKEHTVSNTVHSIKAVLQMTLY